ncbi:helix-turn-helix domain-containing protein [Raoultibacter massiliensis]|uniref:helix-turn-helix domain-containing protein n=1 Tax=Raoultibacter massiliensis TaxID=1852371 RepID=UPI003A9527E8
MDKSKRLAIEIALGITFACFLSTSLLVRQTGGDQSFLAHYTSRAVEIAACFLIAFAARGFRLNAFTLYGVALCALVVYLVFTCLRLVVPAGLFEGQAVLFNVLAGFSDGASIACGILLFARVLCSLSTLHAAVLIPFSWAFSHIIFLSSYLVSDALIVFLEMALLILSMIGLLFFLKRLAPEAALPGFKVARKEKIALAPLLRSNVYFPLYFGMLVFPFFYGLMAQICSDANVSSGLFDVSTEVIGIFFLLLLMASGLLWKNRIDSEGIFVAILPVFATALLFLPLFWGREVFVSGFIMKCGFLIYSSLMWIRLQRMTSKAPDKSYFYFGIALGLYHLALMVGRSFAYALNAYTGFSDQTIASAALFAIWLLSMAALIMLFAYRCGKTVDASRTPKSDYDQSCRAFSQLYGLSEREAAVLQEFARGRTVSHIAKDFIVSPETIKTHLKRIYAKTACHNRQELIDGLDAMTSCDHECDVQSERPSNKRGLPR